MSVYVDDPGKDEQAGCIQCLIRRHGQVGSNGIDHPILDGMACQRDDRRPHNTPASDQPLGIPVRGPVVSVLQRFTAASGCA